MLVLAETVRDPFVDLEHAPVSFRVVVREGDRGELHPEKHLVHVSGEA